MLPPLLRRRGWGRYGVDWNPNGNARKNAHGQRFCYFCTPKPSSPALDFEPRTFNEKTSLPGSFGSFENEGSGFLSALGAILTHQFLGEGFCGGALNEADGTSAEPATGEP